MNEADHTVILSETRDIALSMLIDALQQMARDADVKDAASAGKDVYVPHGSVSLVERFVGFAFAIIDELMREYGLCVAGDCEHGRLGSLDGGDPSASVGMRVVVE